MAAPNTSLRPKARPESQTERMLKPKTIAQVKEDLQQKQLAADFGDVEFRADLEPQFSWNPLARLGYDPKKAKVLPSSLLEPNNAYAIPDSSTVERITNASEFKRSDPLEVERINPGDVVTKGPTAVSPVWSHEFTHKGIERLKEYLDEDPEFFKGKYGEKTFNLINKISKGGKEAKDGNERVTEFFDYLEDTINVPGYTVSKKQIDKSLEIPEIKPETQKLLKEKDFNEDGQISAMEFAQDTFLANSSWGGDREEFQKYLKSPNKKRKKYLKSLFPGLMGAVQAAQDLLEAQGEVPKVKKKTLSFWEKVAKHFGYSRLGFNEGGDVIGPKSELERQREVNIAEQMATLPKKKDEYKPSVDPQKEEIIKKYNLDGARSGWQVGPTTFHTIYENLPTNFRLLTEFILGKDTPITMADFTKDELVSMIALSENQEKNKLNLKNRKLKDQPENVTTVTTYKLKPTDRYPDWVESNPYFRAMAHSLFSPEYQVRTTLGRYDTEDTPSSLIVKDAYDMNIGQRSLPKLSNRKDLAEVLDYMRIDPEMAGEFIANVFRPNPEDSRKIDLVIPKRKKVENFNEGGDVSAQMQSLMIPSADNDIRPEDYVQYREDNFTPASFAEDSWEDTKKRFMDAGRIDVNPDDPAIFTAYKRAVDYLKDTGLAGLGLADTAFKYAVGSAAQVMPTEALEKRMARDLYSMPEAFAGAAGARSLTQLDDAADAFLEGSLHVARKAGQMKPDPNTLASFAGAVPPTYIQRDTPLSEMGEYQLDYFRQVEPTEKTKLKDLELLQFREPISEFIKTLTIPKKGMIGSEFLNQIKKNPSIPETSLQEGIIDPSKRYTKEELLGAIGVGKNTQGTFRSAANISPYRIKQFEGNQRQTKDAGFQGGREVEYFDIPIDTTIGYPGKRFRANYQHYSPETLVHVRGSIVSPYRQIEFSPRKIKEFDKIIGGKNYLLGEELQSDLLTKGYAKPNNFFDAVFSEATKNWESANLVTYQEALGDIDKEIKKVLKLLDDPSSAHLSPGRVSSNPKFYHFSSEYTNKVNFEDRKRGLKGLASLDRIDYDELSDLLIKTSATEKDIDQVFETLKADALLEPILLRKSAIDSMWENDPEAAVFFEGGLDDVDFLTHDELVNLPEVNSINDKGIKEDFLNYHNKRQQALDSATEEYLNFLQSQIDKLKINDTIDAKDLAELHENMIMAQSYTPDTSEIGLPPIRKNKQAVDEALKVLIAKAAQSGVDKIVIPPASRIALARGRDLEKDKGDRFYRTYVTDLNKSLKELEENYPVVIHRDVEMPYGIRGEASTDELIGFEDIDQDLGFDAENDPEITNLLNEMAGDIDMEAIGQQITELVDQNLNDVNQVVVTEPLGNELLPPSQRKKTVDVSDKGTIIDISELVNRFKVEQPRQFAQGGVAMNKQMEMAFMQQGGLQDDGMNQDPVSGNEVPSGSMASEVRDDISAQLSEGEYVVPADVVRYLGVKHFEDLRDKAKNGLNKMETDGRIGGEPVPVGGPKAGLRPDEMQEIQKMFEGGMVAGAANGADFSFYNPTGSTVEEAVTTPGPAGRPMYSGEFSFEQPGAGLATPPPEVTIPETPEQKAVTLYGPSGEVIALMLPRDQTMYDQLIAQGYGLTAPQIEKERSDKDKDKEVQTDPNAWMDKYDYNNLDNLATQTEDLLTAEKGFIGKVLGGGVIGMFISASNAAQAAANIAILKSNGQEAEAERLKTLWDGYVKQNKIDVLPSFTYNGDQLTRQIVQNNPGKDLGLQFGDTDVNGDPIFKNQKDFDDFAQSVAPEGMTFIPDKGKYIRPEGVSYEPEELPRPKARPTSYQPPKPEVSDSSALQTGPEIRGRKRPQPKTAPIDDPLEQIQDAANRKSREAHLPGPRKSDIPSSSSIEDRTDIVSESLADKQAKQAKQKAIKRTEETLKAMERGVQRGFKKGGLMKKKKSKK
jgi:hypothetical protein